MTWPLYLLDEVGVNEFLKGKHTVTASYTATATDKAGVEFSLAGELSFQMGKPSADDVAAAKAAFLGALADKAEAIDVAEVEIEEEDISVTFNWGADVGEVYQAAEELLGAFKEELDTAEITIILGEDEEETFGLHDDEVAVDLALYLLDDIGVNEFLKGKHTVTADYTAVATDKAGVEFSLEGNLTFKMAAPSEDDVAQAKADFLGCPGR
ncbi:MAG: hypothetical protein ACOX3O_01365 [bacterium]